LDSDIDDDIEDADLVFEVAYSSNQKMRSLLEAIGYTQSYSDASIYIYFKDNVRIILPVFVDDMTFASKSAAAIDKTIKELDHGGEIGSPACVSCMDFTLDSCLR
jgi:hypothetical protein